MKIRTNLILILLGTQFMTFLAIGLYFYILSPIDTLQVENVYFQTAARKAAALQVELDKIGFSGLKLQTQAYGAAYLEYVQAMDDMGAIRMLPTLNDTLKKAVESVRNLRKQSASALDGVTTSLASLEAELQEIDGGDFNLDFLTLTNRTYEDSFDFDSGILVRRKIGATLGKLKVANEALSATIKLIQNNDNIVNGEIAKIKARSTTTAIAIIAGILVTVLIFSISMTSNIARAIQSLSRNVNLMASGNLTHRFALGRKDEIGGLGADLTRLLASFNTSLGLIDKVSAQNKLIRQDLLEIVNETNSSSVQIESNTESIRQQMQRMDQMNATAIDEIKSMVESIGLFHQRLGQQNHHISDSVSAVTEMLAAIGNISRITELDRRSAEELVHESEKGKEVFEEAFEKVAEIAESVNAIQEMASVIASISSQTNILAMNAAIEAAHAGEFGKGFAVVADEISKLAAASALSSDEIAHTIADIVGKMTEAGNTRAITSRAFNDINAKIQTVSDSITEIYSNVREMEVGSNHVLQAMEGLRSGSSHIIEESAQVEKNATGIGQTISVLGRVSHEVNTSSQEINIGIQLIAKSIQNISGHTELMAGNGQELDDAIAVFQIDRG